MTFTVRESRCLLLTMKVMPAALTALMDEDVPSKVACSAYFKYYVANEVV